MRIVDADGHVAEGSSLALEAMKRWPQHITLRTDGRPSLMIEGRHYPEDSGPGRRLPARARAERRRRHQLRRPPQGVLGDADRDHIDTMVLYPSFGLCAPSIEDPDVRRRLRAALQPVDRRLLPRDQRAACTASR